jgi:hypothetical protein
MIINEDRETYCAVSWSGSTTLPILKAGENKPLSLNGYEEKINWPNSRQFGQVAGFQALAIGS